MSGCLMSCLLSLKSLRGPQPPAWGYSRFPAAPFFSTPIFNNDWYQKVSKWEPQNNQKSQQSTKTHHRNAPTIKTCKKTLSGRGQTSEIHDRYTLSAVFSEAQGSQKGVKMEAKMMSQDTKNHKSREKRTLEKTSKMQHCKKWVSACLWGGPRRLFSLFFHNDPKKRSGAKS